MSTICCVLHLFGNRLGQKGSTLYVGAFCERAAGTAARIPKQESAMAKAEALVHTHRIGIDDSSFRPFQFLDLNLPLVFIRGDAAALFRLHFSGQISERVSRYPL